MADSWLTVGKIVRLAYIGHMTLAHIRALAEEYAQQYNPDHVAPFPHENVLEVHSDLHIHFVELEDKDVSGVILYQNNEFTILVNIAKSITRQHLTLAHELGHYFLHKDTVRQEQGIIDTDGMIEGLSAQYWLDNPGQMGLPEIEANNFAASLIMPEELVRRAWEATADITACARIFNVSITTMVLRLTKLGALAG